MPGFTSAGLFFIVADCGVHGVQVLVFIVADCGVHGVQVLVFIVADCSVQVLVIAGPFCVAPRVRSSHCHCTSQTTGGSLIRIDGRCLFALVVAVHSC